MGTSAPWQHQQAQFHHTENIAAQHPSMQQSVPAPIHAGAFGSPPVLTSSSQLNTMQVVGAPTASQPSMHHQLTQRAPQGAPQQLATQLPVSLSSSQAMVSTSHPQMGTPLSQAVVSPAYEVGVAAKSHGESYESKLLSLMHELETNFAPPDVAVRALWARLSSVE